MIEACIQMKNFLFQEKSLGKALNLQTKNICFSFSKGKQMKAVARKQVIVLFMITHENVPKLRATFIEQQVDMVPAYIYICCTMERGFG